MEVAAGKTGPTAGVEGDPRSGPTDVAGEHTVGGTSDPWRAFEAWLFHLPGRRLEIHGPLPIAAIAVVADIPYKSRRLPGVDRFLRGPHGHVPPPVRVHRAPPRAPPDRAFRCHGEPDDGVGRTADPRGIPVGHGAAVPDPRPGRRIRAIVPLDRDGDGRGRGRHGATEPVAKSVCGTPDRQREARMPGPFDHPQRAAFAAHSWLIPRLLSRFRDPPVDRQGHTGWTTRSAGRVRNGRFLAQGRRSASSLRTPRGLTTRARIRSISLCGDVDAADIRMPLHRFAGTSRWNEHRDDRAHGRLQNPLAQNDVRAGEPSHRWEARWNKWKGQHRNKPLNEREKRGNETRSKVRARVEHVFGAQSNDMGGTLVRGIGLVRAKARIGLKNLAYNMAPPGAVGAPRGGATVTVFRAGVRAGYEFRHQINRSGATERQNPEAG